MPDNDDALWAGFPTGKPRIEDNQFISPGLQKGLPPAQYRLPNFEDMRVLAQSPEGQARLLQTLEHYGVTPSMNRMKVMAGKYIERMTDKTGDAFKAAVEELVNGESKRSLIGMNREIAQQYSSLRAIEGNIDQKMVWVSEGDDHVCEECDARSGEIQTWVQWQTEGPPGSRTCLGGSYCRCDLLPID